MTDTLRELKQKIKARIQDAKQHGVDDRTIVEGIVNLADVAFTYEEAESREEALIKEMWGIANDQEKRVLAGIVKRLGEQA